MFNPVLRKLAVPAQFSIAALSGAAFYYSLWLLLETLQPTQCDNTSWMYCSGTPATRAAALPADASCEDVDVDPALSFLDGYVSEALQTGAAPYISQQDRFAMGAVRPSHHKEVRPPTKPSWVQH